MSNSTSSAVHSTTDAASASTSTSTSIPMTTHPTPTLKRYDAIFQDELQLQAAQYPTFEEVPGCMTLFDEFLSCYALGPQLRNVYRHGAPKVCTTKFEDFKYCMSLKSVDEEERRKMWIRRRAGWWAARRVGGSSEDVWDVRSAPPANFPPNFGEKEASTSSTPTSVTTATTTTT
ncbi:hypothetical protein FFLO_04715 [Filobasidium floriforme]|uniref:Early meiotic induction protein 1 n=1 Tax=Filobasidium floriforme TaxID=5210 RepID=A0A8K0JIP1_9TREE|nr:hypothetical protein FFLO_04715 [Filobasidium floriforme]